jgi:phage host-nuclease inhibitor protein Gam
MLNLAKKTGMDHLGINLKEIAALTTPVPEEVEQALNTLMNSQEAEAWAKAQPSIKNHYTAQAYNGIDKKIHENAEKLGLSEEEIEELKAEKNTGKKHDMYNAFLQSKIEEAKKSGASAKGDNNKELEAKWQEQVNKIVSEKNKLKEEFEQTIKSKNDEVYNFKKDSHVNSILSSQKWSENYPENIRYKLGRMAIEEKLEKEGIALVLDDKNELKLVRKDSPEMPYFDSSNKNPNFAEFASKTLQENKFLAVSTPVQQNTPKTPVAPVITGQPNTTKRTNSVINLVSQSLKDQGI